MPWYKTGTVSVVQNSNAVIGTGTAFIANARVGDGWRGPDGGWYEVTNIASDTALSIAPPYQGATNAAGTYALAPLQGYVKDSADALRALVNTYGTKLAALGTTGNYDVLPVTNGGTGANSAPTARTNLGLGSVSTENIVPVTKGGTARSDGRISVLECFVSSPGYLFSGQGLSIGWSNLGSGEANFVCNRGLGLGGFRWRTVNSNNTISGPEMIYSYEGILSVPTGVNPASDGGANIGSPSLRFNTFFATTGSINTSDAREKTAVNSLTPEEIKAAKLLASEIGSYKFLSAIAEKGDTARYHIGMTVQRAIEIMKFCNLDPMDYAFICYDEWGEIPEVTTKIAVGDILVAREVEVSVPTEESGQFVTETRSEEALLASGVRYTDYEAYNHDPAYTWKETSVETIVTQEFRPAGNRYGFRYDQLALFIARGQEDRISQLEEKLAAITAA